MLDPLLFIPAVAAILATPGPTNTLLASAGARQGFRRSLGLVPAELFGYALAIAAWGFVLEPLAALLPWLKPALRLGCAAYLGTVAWSLWQSADDLTSQARLDPLKIFTATLLNPKALLFAAAVFPSAAFQAPNLFLKAIGAFALTLLPIACGWIGFGSALGRGAVAVPPGVIQRIAALVLVAFSASLGATALGWVDSVI